MLRLQSARLWPERIESGGRRAEPDAAVRVLVAGASGFVGRRLCPVLQAAGHDVVAMTRNPARYRGAGRPVLGDVQDSASLGVAMSGCEAACYLVHSLESADFERRDSRGAAVFAISARAAGLARIVYLGGLGRDDDELSAHLRSRRDVEHQLASTGVPLTVVRAGIIVGHGGLSWEMTRQLVENLRVMITPKWVATRTQPIAIDDVVRYLARCWYWPRPRIGCSRSEGLRYSNTEPCCSVSPPSSGAG